MCQSCRVYHQTGVSLEEAVKSEKRVKIKTTKDKVFRLKKIEIIEQEYYGVLRSGNAIIRTPLNPKNLKSIRLHNKALSIILGITIPITVFVGLIIYAFSECCPVDLNSNTSN